MATFKQAGVLVILLVVLGELTVRAVEQVEDSLNDDSKTQEHDHRFNNDVTNTGIHRRAPNCGSRLCYRGTCQNQNSKYTCSCTQYIHGDMCHMYQVNVTYCQSANVACYHGQCNYDYHRTHYVCECNQGYTGKHCDDRVTTTTILTTPTTTSKAPTTPTTTPKALTTPTTTPKAPTKSTTTSTTIQTSPSIYRSCKKLSTELDIGNHVLTNNTGVIRCSSGSSATPEAFVLGHCNVTAPSTWRQGVQVMKQCWDIPAYTPVATFFHQHYESIGSLAGVFLGCIPNGFKIGVQQCDKTPTILYITGGLFIMDPALYYTVQ